MKVPVLSTAAAVLAFGMISADAQAQHLNPVIDLLVAKKQVFGLYQPSNPMGRGGRGGPGGPGGAGRGGPPAGAPAPAAPATPAAPPKTTAELAAEAVAYPHADFIFNGNMEGNFDAAYPPFAEFAKAMAAAEPGTKKTRGHPLFVKTPEVAPDPKLAAERIAKQLNTGVMGIVMVDVTSPEEVKQVISAMRFKSKGGTRPDDVGDAPAQWGLSEKEYKEKADVWPLNPKGELTIMVIVESLEGLKNLDAIAAVPGIAVLTPGAGTLGGVLTKIGPDGKDVLDANGRKERDPVRWEAGIQQVAAACKKHKLPCGYPTSEALMDQRIKDGFSVHIINWGEAGFKTVDAGRKIGGR